MREHRRGPLLIGLASVVTGLVLLAVAGAPRELTLLLIAGAVGLVVFAAITHWWKISFHAGVSGGTVAVLAAVFGPAALIMVLLVPVVGWSRIRLAAHTAAEVVAGAVLGALIVAAVFLPLR